MEISKLLIHIQHRFVDPQEDAGWILWKWIFQDADHLYLHMFHFSWSLTSLKLWHAWYRWGCLAYFSQGFHRWKYYVECPGHRSWRTNRESLALLSHQGQTGRLASSQPCWRPGFSADVTPVGRQVCSVSNPPKNPCLCVCKIITKGMSSSGWEQSVTPIAIPFSTTSKKILEKLEAPFLPCLPLLI